MKSMPIAALLLSLCSVSAFAADLPANQAKEMHQELATSMKTMQVDMQKGVKSNDPDIAFAAGMLPHHVGAVKMAQIELKYGKNPQMRELAKNIIASQDQQIKEMQAWLEAHGENQQ